MKRKGFMAAIVFVMVMSFCTARPILAEENSSLEVNTTSKYQTAYSGEKATEGRTALYFYHPRKLVLENQDARVAFWYSSNPEVIRVSSDGIVEAMAEGIADVTAYDTTGTPIQTFLLFATTAADDNPYGLEYRRTSAYDDILFENIQEEINTVTEYASWLYENRVYYSSYEEASNPIMSRVGDAVWQQMADADWIFKNESGICCTVAAGGVYALVGDYEENGLIYMAGPKGHVINYFKENGTYFVTDFTNNISYGNDAIFWQYNQNILGFVKDNTGEGKTLKEAFENYRNKLEGCFFLENHIIYAVDVTGVDYYPAEANNWCQGKDFFKGTNYLYTLEETNIETLYVTKGVDFKVKYVKRDEIPMQMEVLRKKTDTRETDTSVLLADVPELKVTAKKESSAMPIPVGEEKLNGWKQAELLQVIDTASEYAGSFTDKRSKEKRTAVYFYEPRQLTVAGKVAFWYSSDPNVIRVTSDGIVTAYGEGTAEVTAYDKSGKKLQSFSLYTTTHADSAPLDRTLSGKNISDFTKIRYEDIKKSINTITDYVCWMYANNTIGDGYREPRAPRPAYVDYGSESLTVWQQMANSNWILKDFAGVCCNAAAGALYALEGDYEQYGLIFMAGPYGHVLNYYMENGVYYVVDFTAVYGGGCISGEYRGDAERYVKEKTGTGATLQEAFGNYIKKGSGSFYYENYVIYSVDLTGLDYYPAECNNWSWGQPEEILTRKNILYVIEGTEIEVFYVNEKVSFEIQEVSREQIPAKMEVVRIYEK